MKQTTQRQQQFQQLTRPWRDRLYGIALQQTSLSAIAEDWVQETMLRAWRSFDQLSDKVAVYAWLLKILDHVIVDDVRRDSRRHQLAPVVTTDDVVLREHPCAAPGPFDQTLQQQTNEYVTTTIKSLPEEFCRVILLRDIEGLSYGEVAEILDIPQGTVMSRLSRGRRLLATILIKNQGISKKSNDGAKNTGAKP